MEKKKFQTFRFPSESALHHSLFYILLAVNLISLVYFLTLGYYNRLATDDYCYLTGLRDYGFYSPFTFWYQNWQGRFSALFFINIFLQVHEFTNSLLPETILLLVLFTWTISSLIKKLIPVLSPFERLNLGFFLLSVFIINNYEFNTFYWLNASAMYFGGVLFLLVAVNVIVSEKANFWSYALLIFSAIYAGSSSETFALICNGLAVTLIFRRFIQFKRFSLSLLWNNRNYRKLLVAFIFCLVSFLIMYFAPGNSIRLKITSLTAHQTIPLPLHKLVPASVFSFLVFGFNTLLKLPYWLILALPFLYLGNLLRDKFDMAGIKTIRFKLNIVYFILFLWICLIPTVYVQGDMGPKRALTHLALYISFYVAFLAFATGLKLNFNRRKILRTGVIATLFWAIILISYLYHDIPEVRKYTLSDETRITYLKSLRNVSDNDTLLLEPLYLPQDHNISGQIRNYIKKVLVKEGGKSNSYIAKSLGQHYARYPIHPNELARDSNNFVDDCICRSLDLNFKIKLKPDTTKTED